MRVFKEPDTETTRELCINLDELEAAMEKKQAFLKLIRAKAKGNVTKAQAYQVDSAL